MTPTLWLLCILPAAGFLLGLIVGAAVYRWGYKVGAHDWRDFQQWRRETAQNTENWGRPI